MTPPGGPRTGALVVLSPHLDDAVLSCAGLIAAHPGARVVTAFTAGPPTWEGLTAWDRLCGFRPGDDVMAVRKAEDVRALALLGADPFWVGLVEGQYEPRPGPEQVARSLEVALARLDPPPQVIAVPLGVGHADHVLLADAVLALAARGAVPGATWLVYADLPYVEQHPERAEARLADLAARGLALEPVPRSEVDPGRKLAAASWYSTQLRALWGQLGRITSEERCWRLTT